MGFRAGSGLSQKPRSGVKKAPQSTTASFRTHPVSQHEALDDVHEPLRAVFVLLDAKASVILPVNLVLVACGFLGNV